MSKIVIYIGHPADFHLLKNVGYDLIAKGWSVSVLTRNKDLTIPLLDRSAFQYTSLGDAPHSLAGRILSYFLLNLTVLRFLLKEKPDIAFSHGSIHLSQMSWLLGIPHISVEDTGNMEQVFLYRPFSKVILIPDSFKRKIGKKEIRYPGNHELAYLHPSRFSPDPEILKLLGVKKDESYTVIRFVAWTASHDTGHKGISLVNKIKAVSTFSQYSKVFISSEVPLPEDLEQYRLKTPVEKIHDVIAFSSLVFGESASMASEAAVLGVPAIYLDNTGRCYTREEEDRYGLVFNFTESEVDQERSITRGVEILTGENIKEEWLEKRKRFLADKMDVTSFLSWFLETWPASLDEIRNCSDLRNLKPEFFPCF